LGAVSNREPAHLRRGAAGAGLPLERAPSSPRIPWVVPRHPYRV